MLIVDGLSGTSLRKSVSALEWGVTTLEDRIDAHKIAWILFDNHESRA